MRGLSARSEGAGPLEALPSSDDSLVDTDTDYKNPSNLYFTLNLSKTGLLDPTRHCWVYPPLVKKQVCPKEAMEVLSPDQVVSTLAPR